MIRSLLDEPLIGRAIDEASSMRLWIAGDYVASYFLDVQVLTVNRI